MNRLLNKLYQFKNKINEYKKTQTLYRLNFKINNRKSKTNRKSIIIITRRVKEVIVRVRRENKLAY